MGSLPKPLIGLLLGTVAFFALWMVALKPSSSASSTGGSQGGLGHYQSAINKAKGAVATSNQANAKLGAPTATGPAPSSQTTTKAATTPTTKATTTPATQAAPSTKTTTQAKVASASKPAAVSIAAQVTTVVNAIRDRKVVAVLFYNPAAADDQTMVKELSTIRTAKLPLVKISVPLTQLTRFAAVTTKVPVDTSPTLVIVNAKGEASTLTGFAGTGEVTQRINDALAAK